MQSYKKSNFLQYQEASNYDSFESIITAFPSLKHVNQTRNWDDNNNISTSVTIRSTNDDNVHKAIKYGIWTTTQKNKTKLGQLWHKNQFKKDTYLFFSVVKSGMFEGVARLASQYHEQTYPYWWENHTLKFKGYFKIEWVYIKDVNYKHFHNLYTLEDQQVTKSKDCDMLDPETARKMLKIFDKRPFKRWIFLDFPYMDEREKNYVRRMYELAHGVNPQQFQNINYMEGMSGMSGQNFMPDMNNQGASVNKTGQSHIPPPTKVVRPNDVDSGSVLGFQMNPVGKNKKK